MDNIISIIVPCYNQAQYLDQCLKSIYEQIYSKWECIIVNDGSTDNTEKIAKEWLLIDSRFKYIYKENGGLSSARNVGIENALGNYIQFLDSDDLLAPKKLSMSAESFRKNISLDVVITDYNIIYDFDYKQITSFSNLSNVNFNFDSIVNNWDIDFTIPIHCAIFKRSSISELQFSEKLRAKEDWLFWIQFFKKSFNSVFINQQLVSYRRHSNSMTTLALYMEESQFVVLELIKEELSLNEYEVFLFKRLRFYKERYLVQSTKYSNLKNSLTYRFALKLKFIISKFGILPIMGRILKSARK